MEPKTWLTEDYLRWYKAKRFICVLHSAWNFVGWWSAILCILMAMEQIGFAPIALGAMAIAWLVIPWNPYKELSEEDNIRFCMLEVFGPPGL